MKKIILESNLNKELKEKMLVLFNDIEAYVNEQIAETSYTTRKIYAPVEITFNENEIVRVGLANDLYFENYKDIDTLDKEFENDEFNQFDRNGVIEGLIPMNLSNKKALIFIPGIHIPRTHENDEDIFKTVDSSVFFK